MNALTRADLEEAAMTVNGMRSDPRTQVEPRTVAHLLENLGRLRGTEAGGVAPSPTGFSPLDEILGGGLRPGELTLVAGMPGVGKTILTMQWARAIARSGGAAIYACYEHDESSLLTRLIAMELGEMPRHGRDEDDDQELALLRNALRDVAAGTARLADVLASEATIARAYEQVQRFADNLWLVRCSGTHTGLPALTQMVEEQPRANVALFVDYLQKVPGEDAAAGEAERTTRVTEGLKDLALAHRIPVIAVVAGDATGLAARRLRMHHMGTSSALAYESDVTLIVNEKASSVSKAHLNYDPVRARGFRDYSIFSIEKNRGGPALVDLEYRKDFVHFRFEEDGVPVAERLVDEKLHDE